MDFREDEFDVFEKGDFMETIRNVEINQLHDFKNHPFKVEVNTELCELMKSIEKEGVLVPLLVRTNPYGDGYEIISGHRRKEAAVWAGETKVPVVIRELDDDQAVVAMVDSNLHRENLKPSEKAFAYKMKLNAMKHQGKHLDSGTLAQVGPKFTDGSQLNEKDNNTSTINSNELLARQVGESVAQIKRYIRLTKLIPKILDMVDDGKIAFTIAVELSYLHEEDKLKVFDKNSPYLATKKIGKNNPMEEQIKTDNEVRQEWNRTVDRAIVSGMSEEDISSIKKKEITEKVRDSIDLYGDRPDLFASIIKLAIAVLELLINRIMLAAVGVAEKVLDVMPGAGTGEATKTKVQETAVAVPNPEMSLLASKYVLLKNVHKELQRQNEAIFNLERNRGNLEIELSDCNGVFKSRKRTELQKQIDELDRMINNMKRQLSSIVQEYGYDNVKEFYSD